MTKNKNDITKHFDKVIGQDLAKTDMMHSVASFANGGPALSPLITGEKGNGKTHVATAYCDALREMGVSVLERQPDELRTPEGFNELINFIEDSDKWAVWIDEIHLLKKRSTVQLERVMNMIMKMLDKANHGSPVQVTQDKTLVFRPETGIFMGTTNFPEQLDKSGAMQSRFDKMELDLYTVPELVDILGLMLSGFGFNGVAEKTLTQIAKCGRGTARPMEKLVKKLVMNNAAEGKKTKTINRDDVARALRLSRMYPQGLEYHEVQIMAEGVDKIMKDSMILSRFPKIERPQLRKSKGYLQSIEFLHDTSKGVKTTPKGVRFLNDVKKAGFEVPA